MFKKLCNPCLIITGCIAPVEQKYLVIKKSEDRLKQYIDSILFYIDNSSCTHILFCENSGFKYDYNWLVEKANNKGKKFEWLSFCGNTEEVLNRGKGYGEGEILEYALQHSCYEIDYIEKVTGRLIVNNIRNIEDKISLLKNYFNRDIVVFPCEKAIDTRFFCCSVSKLKKDILSLYKNCNDKGDNIEKILYDAVNKEANTPYYPVFKGYSGGFGFDYADESKLKKGLLNLLCRMRLYNNLILLKIVRKVCTLFNQW